jgi:hypothetical protein
VVWGPPGDHWPVGLTGRLDRLPQSLLWQPITSQSPAPGIRGEDEAHRANARWDELVRNLSHIVDLVSNGEWEDLRAAVRRLATASDLEYGPDHDDIVRRVESAQDLERHLRQLWDQIRPVWQTRRPANGQIWALYRAAADFLAAIAWLIRQ